MNPTIVLSFCFILTYFEVLPQGKRTEVLFVCEHGSAKSVVAAIYFAKLASNKGLRVRAISRGTNPDTEIPEKVNQFLIGDGFEKPVVKPQKLSEADLRRAYYVVMFTSLPANYDQPVHLETWDIPSFEAGYPAARDSIVNNIERLLVRIKSNNR